MSCTLVSGPGLLERDILDTLPSAFLVLSLSTLAPVQAFPVPVTAEAFYPQLGLFRERT